MPTTEQPTEPKKIALYLNEAQAQSLKSECDKYCEVVNCVVVPLLEQYNITNQTHEDILDLAKHHQRLKDLIIESEVKNNLNGTNKYLKTYIETEVTRAVQETIKKYYDNQEHFLNGKFDISERCKPFLIFDNNGICIADLEKINASCTRYAEGAEFELWAKLNKATDLLNEVFNGHAPLPKYIGCMWREVDGVLEIRKDLNLSKFL